MGKKSEDKFLVVKGRAGMGNRILAFLEAVVYAKLSNRKIIADWRDRVYSPKGINSFHQFFTSPLVMDLPQMPSTESVIPVIWKKNLNKDIYTLKNQFGPQPGIPNYYLKEKKKYSIDLSKIDYKEKFAVMFDYSFRIGIFARHFKKFPKQWPTLSKFSVWKYPLKNYPSRRPEIRKKVVEFKRLHFRDSLLSYLIKNYLSLKPDILKKVVEFKRLHFKKPTIGIHIRYTDNLKVSRKIISLHKYPYIIDSLLKKNPRAIIFLSTDNQEILKEYKKKYKNVITTKKFYPAEGGPVHLSKECKDKIQNGIEAIIDMYLLGECDYLVYSEKSSFGRVAAILSVAKKKNIIEVEKFFGIFSSIKQNYYQALGIAGIFLKRHLPGVYRNLKKYFPDKK